ncbi:MAG TPA: sterol desaturase family protein [Pyrinomonadaceae bacterium]|nr:sterol desaturase family protein [Pyrinomonadaceae bacterium]
MKLFNVWQFLLVAAVFVPLERLFALHKEQRILRAKWRLDLVYTFVNGALITVGIMLLVLAAGRIFAYVVPESLRVAVASQPLFIQLIEAVVTADILFYAAHRLFHSVPFLWKLHAVHHSIEEMDWLAAARVHPLDQIVTKGASILPLLALGFSDPVVAAHAFIYSWHSYLLHSNVRIKFGPLKWVIASPEYHHWHHANHREAYDKNYAAQLSIIDKLFHTLYLPQGKTPEKYGIDEPVPRGYISQLISPSAGK